MNRATEYTEKHEELRDILAKYGEEFGDCILDEICELFEYELTPAPEEEKDVPVLFYTIKNKIGWSKWCDITDGNHWALNEGYSPRDNEVFYCTKSQAEKLGLL